MHINTINIDGYENGYSVTMQREIGTIVVNLNNEGVHCSDCQVELNGKEITGAYLYENDLHEVIDNATSDAVSYYKERAAQLS